MTLSVIVKLISSISFVSKENGSNRKETCRGRKRGFKSDSASTHLEFKIVGKGNLFVALFEFDEQREREWERIERDRERGEKRRAW